MKRGAADKFSASEHNLVDKTNEPSMGVNSKANPADQGKPHQSKSGQNKVIRDLQQLATEIRHRYLSDVASDYAER
jgi:hypothetical protein